MNLWLNLNLQLTSEIADSESPPHRSLHCLLPESLRAREHASARERSPANDAPAAAPSLHRLISSEAFSGPSRPECAPPAGPGRSCARAAREPLQEIPRDDDRDPNETFLPP